MTYAMVGLGTCYRILLECFPSSCSKLLHEGLGRLAKIHGDDFLVLAWPNAVPRLPLHFDAELIQVRGVLALCPGWPWQVPPMLDHFKG